MADAPPFLFSIDLEDVRTMIPEGHRYADRVPLLVGRYLELLERRDLRCTFFTVGDVARRHPALVRDLAAAGHEIACHGSDHVPLDRMGRAGFREDLARNLEDLARAGCGEVQGFRAPVYSLTERTPWAWEVMAELGIRYSSSVLPARHPLHGWPGFSRGCSLTEAGVWELPFSLAGVPGLDLPFAGGVYLRALPFALVRSLFRREIRSGRPVVGYAHPFDIDPDQERFVHPELGGRRLYHHLMYWNRRGMLGRIERLAALGSPIVPYAQYVSQPRRRGPAAKPVIEIRPTGLSADGLESVAALLRRRFPRAAQVSAAYLAWTYRDNPEGTAFAWDAWDGALLVAHVSATPMRARLEGAEEGAVLIQHVATERGFEGRGLFKTLVGRALAASVDRGFGHAIGLANANSRFALAERLDFQMIRPLDVRIGIGAGPEPLARSAASWERVWEPRTLAWRLARPDLPYRAVVRGARARILCASGYPAILADLGTLPADALPEGLPAARALARPRVWIGLDPDLDWRRRAYAPLPPALRPAPLHFMFRDLRASGRSPDAARLRVAALDFDAY